MNRLSRRQMLGYGGAALGGAALGGVLAGGPPAAAEEQAKSTGHPWTYHRLAPDATADRGYAGYYAGRCCYGVFEAINGALGDAYGAPYNTFPTGMLAYGKSGVAGFGTLCGALNGAAAAIGLYLGTADKKDAGSKARDALISELFRWYEEAELPQYRPAAEKVAEAKGKDVEIVPTCGHSVICHRSVGVWCEASGCAASSKERSERCARLTADVARKTVELLNAHLDSAGVEGKPGEGARSCLSCHGKGGSVDNAKVKMDCGVCHNDNLHTVVDDHGS